MKVIELKNVKIDYGTGELTPQGAPEFLDYKTTIMALLKTPKDPQAGATFEEIAQAMPIWKKFSDTNKPVIQLEDAEHQFVVSCLKNAKYIQRSYELFEMITAVEKAPEHLSAAVAN